MAAVAVSDDDHEIEVRSEPLGELLEELVEHRASATDDLCASQIGALGDPHDAFPMRAGIARHDVPLGVVSAELQFLEAVGDIFVAHRA